MTPPVSQTSDRSESGPVDLLVIGGGIVGLATAWQYSRRFPDDKILILEKEGSVAAHQTSHNSGVLHTGIYYKPGSMKAVHCREGKRAMEQFCAEHAIPYEICGKVIVAVHESEFAALDKIYERGQANGVRCEPIDRARLRELEPHAAGQRAIHVPEAGIVDYLAVCQQLARLLLTAGHRIVFEARVTGLHAQADGCRVASTAGEFEARRVVNCAGLHCDRVARLGGAQPDAKIVPFRGEYYELRHERERLCRNLIYPVPDPNFPFLGVHFTRMIRGGVECGPNAVLAFAREGYTRSQVNLKDLFESLTYPGFVRLARRHWRMGCGEMWRSFSKRAFVKALQRLMPEIQASDLTPAPAGIRAQALTRTGSLVDDFLIVERERVINVLNAPSPAATASLRIGESIVERLTAQAIGT
ncbi:MAG: L-2-hydroxyglutarate oxidase [Planctomycetota bacterium]